MKKLLILFFAFFLVSCQSQTGKDGGVFIETSQKMAVIGDTVYFLSVNDGVCCFREGKVTTLLSEERLFLSRLFIYDGTVYAAGMDRREDSDTDGHFVLYRKGETGFELLLATTDILDADILCGMVDGVFYGYSRSPAQQDVLFTCNLKNGKWKEDSGFLGRDFSVSYSEHTMFYQ